MAFDPVQYEKDKARYLKAFLEAYEEGQKENRDRQSNAVLNEAQIVERSGLSRMLVDRISDDFENEGLIDCLGGDGEEYGRLYHLNDDGLTYAQTLQYEKSALAKRRKIADVVKEMAKNGVRVLVEKIGIGIASYLAGVLTGIYGPTIAKIVKRWLEIK